MTIVEFLEARITEDEDAARMAGDLEASVMRDPLALVISDRGAGERSAIGPNNALEVRWLHHASKHMPGRILAECEAKRRIVHISKYAADRVPPKNDGYAEARARETLRLLAMPYADHPDYNPDWTPITHNPSDTDETKP